MNKVALAAAFSLATILPFATAPAFANTVDTQTSICAQGPAKAAKAGVDCTTTSTIRTDDNNAVDKYPSAPVSVGSGIVF